MAMDEVQLKTTHLLTTISSSTTSSRYTSASQLEYPRNGCGFSQPRGPCAGP